MSKKQYRNNSYNDLEYEDDYVDERGYQQELRERRKLKRMKNALRARKIDDLMNLDEDEY